MTDHVYKHIELTGSSTTSIEDAVQKALDRAAKTVRNMRWFEVVETRGQKMPGHAAAHDARSDKSNFHPYMVSMAWSNVRISHE